MNPQITLSHVLATYSNTLTCLFEAAGSEEVKSLMVSAQIQEEVRFESPRELYIIFQIIHGFINSLATEDPNKVHRDIVRESLKRINNSLINDAHAVDMLARELVRACKLLKMRLKIPPCIQELIRTMPVGVFEKESGRTPLSLIARTDTFSESDAIFTANSMFIWDKELLETIKSIGPKSKLNSKVYVEPFKERYTLFTKGERDPLKFWFNTDNATPEQPIRAGHALTLLVNALYLDIIEKNLIFRDKNIPAITTRVWGPLGNIFSPNRTVKKSEEDKAIQIYTQETLVGQVSIPTISEKILNSVLNGVHKLNTVTGHRLVRYLPQKTFERMINNDSDYRVLKFKRGATEIAEELGISSNKAITNIKEIIHAMAFFHFSGPTLSGNLIQLTKHTSPTTHRAEAYVITVGTPLLPYRCFEDGGLLIPILKDPPLVHSNQYHANQYMMQNKVIEEFSRQSVLLATEGIIEINEERWYELGRECDLTAEIARKVHDRWIQDGTDGPKFLELIEPGFYTLGTEHSKVCEFLKDQGKLRKRQSEKGKKAATLRVRRLQH
jgi:hypothetical protein